MSEKTPEEQGFYPYLFSILDRKENKRKITHRMRADLEHYSELGVQLGREFTNAILKIITLTEEEKDKLHGLHLKQGVDEMWQRDLPKVREEFKGFLDAGTIRRSSEARER